MCHQCQKGHYAKVCQSGKNSADKTTSTGNVIQLPMDVHVAHAVSPYTRMCIRQTCANTDIYVDALPDTGASKTLISWNMVKTHNMNVQQSPHNMQIFAANNTEIQSHGIVQVIVTYKDIDTHIEAITTEGMEQLMLICYSDLVKKRILNPTFPREVCHSAQQNPLKEPLTALIDEFSDIFNDGDEILKPMIGPPMHIHLKKGPIKPIWVLTAQRVPIHLEKAANEAIQAVLKASVIRPVHKPTEWISPALFIAKPNGKVRMVTDYRQLNKHIDRPVHPFPSADEFTSSIPPGTKWFVKLDAKNGYF